jgi:hypothetical protein
VDDAGDMEVVDFFDFARCLRRAKSSTLPWRLLAFLAGFAGGEVAIVIGVYGGLEEDGANGGGASQGG